MKLLDVTLLLIPVFLHAQAVPAAPDPPYRDGLLALGLRDGAPAIDSSEKFKLHMLRIVSPSAFLTTSFTAGIRQAQNSPGAYGRTWEGYGKRFGTNLARTGIRETIAGGIDSAAHLDPRFYRAPAGSSTRTRLWSAVSQVVVTRTDSGGRNFSYGRVIGTFAAGEAGSLWLPRRSEGRFGDGMVWAGLAFATDAGRFALREFWPDIRRKFSHK